MLLIGLAHLQNDALAEQTESAEISFKGDTYTYTFTTVLDGASERIREIVTDYDRLGRINDSIVESRVLERLGPHELKRLLRLRQCVLVFCFDLDFVELVRETPAGIIATIVPGESNFRDGVAEWLIEPIDGEHTRMTLNATQTPDFWLPPIIGPMILKRVVISEVRETSARIEALVAAQVRQ